MADMIDKVAQSIYEGRNGPGAVPWAQRKDAHKAPYRADARAALETLREPTAEMETAGNEALSQNGLDSVEGDDSTTGWQAMIDAALAPFPTS